MSLVKFSFLFAVLYSCSGLGHGGVTTTKMELLPVDPHVTEAPEAPAPTPLIITTSDSPAPDTNESKTTKTTTHKPTTTSTTTTTQNTTTTTTTTTEKPTTTTLKPTPPPTPRPVPPPEQGTWLYTNSTTNITCVKVQFAAQFNVTYNKAVNNSIALWQVLVNVPANATVVNGSCSGDQWLTLSWLTTNASALANTLTLVYHSNLTDKNYALKSLNVSLAPDNFVNASSTEPMLLYHGGEWRTPLATSYRCGAPTLLNMTAAAGSAALTLTHLQEEAYRTAPGHEFSAARECGGSDVPDAVPIAVGCALGALVLVVLVAYLVGRRRSAARGYLSM